MLNKRLKLFRIQNKLSQQHLADALGVERSTYCGYETGRRKVNVETLLKLSEFYNLPMNTFLDEPINKNIADENYESAEIMYLSQLSKDERDLIVYYRLAQKQNKKEAVKLLKDKSEK